jgi:hypothetical protein
VERRPQVFKTFLKIPLDGLTQMTQLSGFKACNFFPFNGAPKKPLIFQRFPDSEPACTIAIGWLVPNRVCRREKHVTSL